MANELITGDAQRTDHLPAVGGVYGSIQSFEDAQRMAGALCASSLVPADYQGNKANCMIALEMSQRIGASPMAVMQNLHIIHGRPSWSSQFVIAALNSCGRFSAMRFRVEDLGETDAKIEEWNGPKGNRTKTSRVIKVKDQRCVAWCYDKSTGDVLEGPPVTIGMAVSEGWYTKDGSKWVTMPDLMLRYRSAKFFGNLYAPDVLMGMHTQDEIEDFAEQPVRVQQTTPAHANDNVLNDLNSLNGEHKAATATVVLEGEIIEPEGKAQQTTATPRRGRRSTPAKDPVETAPQADPQKEVEQQADPVVETVADPVVETVVATAATAKPKEDLF